MDTEQLDKGCEWGILGLVLAALAWSPVAFGLAPSPTSGFDSFLIVQWMMVAVLGLWMVRFCVNPKHRLLWPPVCWPILGTVLYAVVRYVLSDIEYVARQELLHVLVYAVLFYGVVHNLHRQEATQIVGVTVLFLGMALALFAIYQFLTGTDLVWGVLKAEGFRKRGSGTFLNPNHLACYLGLMLPLGMTFTLTGRFEALQKIFLGYASLAIFAGIAVTVSRAGWLATGVSLLVLVFWLLRQRDYWKRGLAVLLVLGAIFTAIYWKAEMPPERHERFEVARQVEDARFLLWPVAISIWKDHPWIGAGLGHFDARFRQYRPEDLELQDPPGRAQSDYLNTLADWGLVGALLMQACVVAFFYQVFTVWKFVQRSQSDLGAKRSNKSAVVAGGALGLTALVIFSTFESNLHVPANALLAVTLMALVAAHYRFASERYWHTVRWPLRVPVLISLLGVAGYLGWQGWRHTGESSWMAKAMARPEGSEERLTALRNAWVAEDRNPQTAYLIGETLRLQGGQPGTDGKETKETKEPKGAKETGKALAQEAIRWFQKSAALNRYDPSPLVGEGMTLDALGEHPQAATLFEKAGKLDPNGFSTEAALGWHYYQVQDYTNAVKRFQRSQSLMDDEKRNPIPFSYLKRIEAKQRGSAQK